MFDGRMRYDLQFAYKRMDKVKADKGYDGPAVVCAVYFAPVAGYIPSRAAIKYLTKQRDMEVWLAPIAGTRVLVPFRVSIPTPIGTGVMQATSSSRCRSRAPRRPARRRSDAVACGAASASQLSTDYPQDSTALALTRGDGAAARALTI